MDSKKFYTDYFICQVVYRRPDIFDIISVGYIGRVFVANEKEHLGEHELWIITILK